MKHRRSLCFRKLHEWTPANTIFVKDRKSKDGLGRQCRTCKNIGRKEWRVQKILKELGIVEDKNEV